jgi:hypothetical protein
MTRREGPDRGPDGSENRPPADCPDDSLGDDSSAADAERVERLREAAREQWGGGDDDLDAISAGLTSDDADVRARAAWSLAELAAEDPERSRAIRVDTKVAPLLEDDDQWVRRGASWAVATVADEHPQRVRQTLSAVTDGLGDEDPLVRENSVLALGDVAMEYPRAVEPALSHLADLVDDGDGLASQYAAETLRKLVRRLDEDGFPLTVAATPELAGFMPGDADVVAVTDDPSDGQPVGIRGGTGERQPSESEGESDDDEADETLGPPDQIPSPPEIVADRRAFDRLGDLGTDPLTTVAKARAPSPGEGGQHVVASVRTLRSDVHLDPERVATAFRAWEGVDDHDHVVPVLARGTTPRPWLATEFLDGGTLRDHLGSVGFERGLWYAHRITTTVCHAHARGVVHGALRPGAVGLSRTIGGWPVPKVGDWGLGDLFAEVREVPVPPAYAAPEHVAPETFGRPDPATDVYQLGAVCYALFAGRPPFSGEAREVTRKVESETPRSPSEFAPRLPTEIDDLLGRALIKEKPARFETAGDFRRELELIVEQFAPEGW